jgi:hypothetical protein
MERCEAGSQAWRESVFWQGLGTAEIAIKWHRNHTTQFPGRLLCGALYSLILVFIFAISIVTLGGKETE